MNRPLSYALKIWVTALLVCPIIIAIYASFKGNNEDAFPAVPFLIFFGAIFSFPSLLLLWLAIYLMRYWDAENYQYQKQVLSIVCTILSGLPFVFLFGDAPLDMICFFALYAAGTVVGVWIYDLHPKEEYIDEEPETINEDAA